MVCSSPQDQLLTRAAQGIFRRLHKKRSPGSPPDQQVDGQADDDEAERDAKAQCCVDAKLHRLPRRGAGLRLRRRWRNGVLIDEADRLHCPFVPHMLLCGIYSEEVS